MRIAVDEIHAFLLHNDMMIYLVVFDDKATGLGKKLDPDLEAYIDRNYVEEKSWEEYAPDYMAVESASEDRSKRRRFHLNRPAARKKEAEPLPTMHAYGSLKEDMYDYDDMRDYDDMLTDLEEKLKERLSHRSDTFSQYLLYLIEMKGLSNADVWKNAIVDKKVFSKIKNNKNYHPNKRTALCLCVGARLNMDETRDLLARAGYALSPCDMTDIIFSYFIENEIYDMIELDIQLEGHGLPCIIS